MYKRINNFIKRGINFILFFALSLSLFQVSAFAATGTNIYFDNSVTKWDKVFVYYFGASGNTWPGTEMSPVVGQSDIYKITLPAGVSGMVFNNEGKGQQSTDVVDIQPEGTYVALGLEGGKYVVMKKDASGNVPGEPDPSKVVDIMKTPMQLNLHIGVDYSKVNLTFTTAAKIDTKVIVKKEGETVGKEFTGTNKFSFLALKYYNTIELKDLEASTKYNYTIGQGVYSYSGSFKTAPKSSNRENFKFAYIADPQVSNDINAKALGATFNELNNTENLGFVYIAGDLTDNSTAEKQWEYLFENSGKFPKSGRDLFGNKLISVTQGNHDISTFTGHITPPAEEGDAVYSYDYGSAKFIILNLETAKSSTAVRDAQKAFLQKKVLEAKNAGQWTIVGFHKSIYTGASHIVDADVTEARKYFGPIFASLDVDVVLQGHDHVYSRGFINAEGSNANLVKDSQGTYTSKDNVPLYMVGGHAGGLKWYSKKAYTVSAGDPLTANYSFLDKNSTDDGSDVKKEQTYTVFEISKDAIKFNTYMFKYDTDLDQITTQKYLYDSFKMVRKTYSVTLPNVVGATVKPVEGSYNIVLPGESYSFTLGMDSGYSNSTVSVKANGIKISPINGVYTVSNINENTNLTVEGVSQNSTLPNDTQSNNINSANNQSNAMKSGKGSAAKTGDDSIIVLSISMLMVSIGACIFTHKKKINSL